MFNSKLLSGNTNPYASTAVVVDSTAPVQYYLQQQAHQAALDEAANKHILDKIAEFSKDAIRPQDTPDLLKIKNDFQTHAISNADKLRNTSLDKGNAYLASQGFLGKASQHVAMSKAAKEEQKAVLALQSQELAKGHPVSDENAAIIDAMNYPVTDPRHYKDGAAMTKPYTVNDWKPYESFDPDKFVEVSQKNALMSKMKHPTKKGYKDATSGQMISPFVENYDDKNIQNIALAASGNYQKNKNAADKFFGELIKDPNELNKLENTFKQIYNRPLSATDGKDVAVAYALSRRKQGKEGFDKSADPNDWMAKFNYEKAYENNKKYEAYKLQPHEYPKGTSIGNDGIVYTNQVDAKGRKIPYTGMIQVPIEKAPQQAIKEIRSGSTKNAAGDDIVYDIPSALSAVGDVPIYVENGVPQYIGTEESSQKVGGYFPLVPNKKGKVPVGKPITTNKGSSSVSKSVESTKKVPTFNMK